jgi:hypothetical protein
MLFFRIPPHRQHGASGAPCRLFRPENQLKKTWLLGATEDHLKVALNVNVSCPVEGGLVFTHLLKHPHSAKFSFIIASFYILFKKPYRRNQGA